MDLVRRIDVIMELESFRDGLNDEYCQLEKWMINQIIGCIKSIPAVKEEE